MLETSEKGLRFDNVSLSLKGRCLVAVNHLIRPGDVLTVMGESGSGKSTLLNLVAGFLPAAFEATGRVTLNGVNITEQSAQTRNVGLMFQSPLLFPHMSVGQNLLFALPRTIKGRQQRLERVIAALEEVGLGGFEGRDPATLSGGQQTRVALMRLILAEPQALLLDEPFSSLDRSRRADVRELVFDTTRDRKLPVLLVTHDAEDAEAAGGSVIEL
ncbi:Fe(3+) ions import ATP-binding protein FbpC [Roseibium sp. TrichSKD4]|uniref:ATP-binding cassette domain-containing protein n=1 Tax=Roseibium sp. TrichSKD4 TaxID=744980 RepID=UPI0001E5644D|nr:ATP-binding cassette domain-containing protein [Roseibium sp. TrichSKD4]EFO33113.1 Fe(3+) ions import ATP-binding protein FbpC [Roseibium sp. TrichSKD4]